MPRELASAACVTIAPHTWTIHVGGGFGRVMPVFGLPINMSLASFYNVEEPDNVGPQWSVRASVQFLFPR